MFIQTSPTTHYTRRPRRRAEHVRQYCENKSTPRARWINTVQPSKQPCWRLCVFWVQHLFFSYSGQTRTSAAFVDFLKQLQAQLEFQKTFVLRLPSHVVLTTTENHMSSVWEQAGEIFNVSDSPLFESRICTPADHAHCWRTSSSGHNAPLDLFAQGTQSQIHLRDWERDQIKLWQSSKRWQTWAPRSWRWTVVQNPACTLKDYDQIYLQSKCITLLSNSSITSFSNSF